jgi:toxin ParE1/3/4
VARLRWLPSAQADLVAILEFVALQSGSVEIGLRLVGDLRRKCLELSGLPATIGRARPELRSDIRSFPHKGYVIFFRYVDGRFEVVNIIQGHRDIDAMFQDDQS